MQINVTNKEEQPLLSRTMIRATLEFEKATPSYKEAASMISSHMKADENLIAIQHIYNVFGHKKAEVTAYIYSDEGKKRAIEPKSKKAGGEKKPEEAKPEPEKKEKTKQEKQDKPEAKEEQKEAKKAEADKSKQEKPETKGKPKEKTDADPKEDKPKDQNK